MTAAAGGERDAIDRRLAVAPMMDRTDRFDRYLLRLISRRVLLYTEMVTTGAVLYGDRDRLLAYDSAEHPVVLQLGGSDPADLATSARAGADLGYDEINLNVGCPSNRVQSGRFGACLMAEPERVADCIAAMRDAAPVPVTVKTRIGVDDLDSFEHLAGFVETVAQAGCRAFIIHARKAWLSGLSPKENREVPPLRYDVAARLKDAFPQLEIVLNGGLRSLAEVRGHLDTFDGVMIGRAAYDNPFLLAEADGAVFGDARPAPTRDEVIERYLPYLERQLFAGVPLTRMTRHLTGLYHGQPGGRLWRRHLSESAHKPGAGAHIVREALDIVRSARSHARAVPRAAAA